MLKVNNLSKQFNSHNSDVFAVENLTFQVRPGQIYALIGPNGAGKTTTIKIIVGLYFPTAGFVDFYGENIIINDSPIRNKIGYVPDEPVFYPYLTGWETLEFVRRIYQIEEREFRKRLTLLFDYYPIESMLSAVPDQYSRGNKQKLSIISAFARSPKLLVFDEPIVGLDPNSIEATDQLLRQFTKKNGIVLLSTHTLPFIERLAHRVGILYSGKLIKEATVSQILKQMGKPVNLSEAFLEIISKQQHSL